MWRLYNTIFSFSLSGLLVFTAVPVGASVMQSERFGVSEDSFDVSGGQQESNGIIAVTSAGQTAAGAGSSENARANAGYVPQAEDVFITINGVAPVVMDTPIGGLSGGESNGSTTLTVTTNSPTGYQVSVAAETAPAMKGELADIQNYVPTSSSTDFDFVTTGTDTHFGFSVFGTDVVAEFQSSGSTCGAGSALRGFCWRALGNSDTVIAQSNGPTSGTDTEILYRVGIGGDVMQLPGNYVSTTTITVLAL